jgi:catechol 2,3-dioxygenase-like lactoylglutathione lyase family enzyme
MAITGLGHIFLRTSDFDKTIKFYENLGFTQDTYDEIVRDGGVTRLALISCGNCVLEVCQPVDADLMNPDAEGCFAHLCLSVDNLANTVEDLKSKGVVFVQDDIQTLSLFGGIRNINLIGPSGETLELYEPIEK